MKVIYKLNIKLKGDKEKLYFGIANTESEKEEVYALRHKVYLKKDYIDEKEHNGVIEKDELDTNGNCVYFIAKSSDGKIFGTVRLIKTDPLPTEIYYSFNEPEDMKKIPRGKRFELGRLIVEPYNSVDKKFLPQGIVMFFLICSLIEYSKEHGFEGGYSFIKNSLETKMEQRKIPFKRIKEYKEDYPKNDTLYKYFTQENDPVIPIYFLRKDFDKYKKKMLRNKLIFKKKSKKEFVYRAKLINKMFGLLKFMKK